MSTDIGLGSNLPRFGVEEEFLIVDPASRAAAPEAEAVVHRAVRTLGGRVCGEITKFQLETKTDPCRTLGQLETQLVEARAGLGAAAAAEGLRIVASGTPVLGDVVPPPITSGSRQDRGIATFRGLHDDIAVCALHVHVELADRERALLVSNHLRPYLPILVALGANSPFWDERDSGYASWRTTMFHRWPVAGPPPYFTSLEQYERLVATLHEVGAVVDVGTIFWDIRPSSHVPTLEIRATDVPITAWEAARFAALVRGLVLAALSAVDAGDPGPVVQPELMRLAYWRAARDGLSGHGIDVHTGQLVSAVELAERLIEIAEPKLAELGELEPVTDWLEYLVLHGDGATRQRRVAAAHGQLTDVVDHLIAETAPASAHTEVAATA
jgi:carboxylate-amine ligase